MSTFATWVANTKGNAALNAALAVARREANAPNPLVLVGGVGSGKTHLLYAIADEMRSRPTASILHLPIMAFVDRLTHSIRADALSEFRRWTESFDSILLDDLHLLADREVTLREVVLTLAERAAAGAQVVVTSDRRLPAITAPAQVVEVKYPDTAARTKILRATSEQRGFPLSEDFARAIARRIRGNARQLHATVSRLIAERVVARSA